MNKPADANTLYEYTFTAEQVRLYLLGGHEPAFYPHLPNAHDDIPHTHEWYEMFFVEQGGMQCHFQTTTQLVNSGDFIIIKPGVSHYTQKTDPSSSMSVFNFSFEVLDAGLKIPWLSLFSFPEYLHFQPDLSCRTLGRLFGDALQAGHGTSAGSYLFSLLTHISSLLSQPDSPQNLSLPDSNLGRIFRLNQILQNYYRTDITLSVIAAQLHISERQLSRIMQKQFGCGFREKITSLRMEEAKKLLSDGNNIKDVAFEVGYSSISAFHSAFTKHFGTSPGTFKHQP